jgi:L-asparagine transporter-like permease
MKFFKFLFSIAKWIIWLGLSLIIAVLITLALNHGDSDINLTILLGLWIIIFLPTLVIKMRKIRKNLVVNDK